jgi:ATP-dependent DNA helicase RecG
MAVAVVAGREATEWSFSVTLANTPMLTDDDRAFVASLGTTEVGDVEFRALLEAHQRGRVDNARLRAVAGLDTLAASALLRRLRDRGLLTLRPPGAARFYVLTADRQGFDSGSTGGSSPIDRGSTSDRQGLDVGSTGVPPTTDRGSSFETIREGLPDDLTDALGRLGARPRQPALRSIIRRLCAWRPLQAAELGALLGMTPANLVRRHLGPMAADGQLERTVPQTPAHPGQAYRTPRV